MATLAGKVIVVVGGSSGIGYGVAKASLLSRAAHVIIASSSQAKVTAALAKLQAEVSSAGVEGKVTGDVVDARDSASVKALCARVGEVDHFMNKEASTAFISGSGIDLDPRSADMFDLRFWGAATAAQAVKIRPGGSITFTIGALLVKPLPSFSLVVANIGAVDALTRGLAVDLAPVRVNVVSPGIVKTEFIDLAPEMREKMYEDAERKLLVKHVADPDEVAEAYLFLMKCGYITGQRIEVDGGGNPDVIIIVKSESTCAPSIIMEKLSVLIIGATGRTGSSITDALLKHPNFHVIALVRPSSASKPAIAALQKRGVEIRVADLDPSAQEQLVEALRGADVVICAILGREIAPQYALIDAVKKAGVKRFVPNDWSPACTRGIRQLHDEKLAVHEYVKEAGIGYTFIDVGW
ncbi:hypothetical protein EW145_g7564, partial [Phellinidium pouzarii]